MKTSKTAVTAILTLSLALAGCGAPNTTTSGNQNTGNPTNSSQQSGATQDSSGKSTSTGTSDASGSSGSSSGSSTGSSTSTGGTGTNSSGNTNSVTQGAPTADKPLTIDLISGEMKKIGTATLTEEGMGVSVKVEAAGLTPGQHGIHIHETAKCEGPAFTTAGGHFNPSNKRHGDNSSGESHAGDLMNIEADKDGKVNMTVKSDKVTLGTGKENSLLDAGGKALVIHAKPDDGKTDPSGNSGDRIACGLIVSPQ